MLIGYNNDVDHRGKTFHIQTEDRGVNDDTIETQLFCGGAILDTNITNYTELVKDLRGKEREKKIKSIMKASHRSLFKKLMAGEYDQLVGLEPRENRISIESEAVGFEPGRDGVPAEGLAIEAGEFDAVVQASVEKHVGLSQLRDKLAKLTRSSGGEISEPMESPRDRDVGIEVTPDTREKLKSRFARKQGVSGLGLGGGMDWKPSGVRAWTGCEPLKEDLSLTQLVEDFLGS